MSLMSVLPISEIIWDVETKKFFDDTGTSDPADLGVSIVSLYHRQLDENFNETKGEMLSFWEQDFDHMWKLFLEADRIIGFNSRGFDVPAMKPYAPPQFAKLPHFDILEKLYGIVGRRMSLNALAKDTLDTTKIDSGVNAIIYWEKGDPKSLTLLKKYCEADVAITRDLYDFALKNKFLKYTDHWNNPRLVEVDFSYPKDVSAEKQLGLF
jgi:DEAD/DEAH box helicase domain-containing protein